jgi:hypothetical protein
MKTKSAIRTIAAERKRGVRKHKYTADKDDLLTRGELTKGAMSYLAIADMQLQGVTRAELNIPTFWPFEQSRFQPSEFPTRNLVKAAAMVAAEIDRLNRLALKQAAEQPSGAS